MVLSDDILSMIGLVDPKTGEVVQTDDIPGPEPTTPEDDGAPSPSSSGKTGPNWDSEDNPYFRRVKEIESSQPTLGQTLEQQKTMLRQQAATAYDYAVSQGMSPQLAQAILEPRLEAELAKTELQVNRQATLPMARRQAAEGIAKEVSDKNITINPDELLVDPNLSLEGMKSRAKALYDERRKFKYDSRRVAKTDSAEGGPPTGSKLAAAAGELSPQNKIKYGLMRGDIK